MDGISAAAASILGVCTAGVQVSMKLYILGKQYKAAPERINWITNEVSFTSSVLKEISVLMDHNPSEEVDSIFSESSLQITTTSTNAYRKVIMELQTMLTKVGHGSSTGNSSSQGKFPLSRAERVHWLFNSDRADEILDELGKAKDSLMFVLQLATLGYARKVAKSNKSKSLSPDEERDLKEGVLTLWADQRANLESLGKLNQIPETKEPLPENISDHKQSKEDPLEQRVGPQKPVKSPPIEVDSGAKDTKDRVSAVADAENTAKPQQPHHAHTGLHNTSEERPFQSSQGLAEHIGKNASLVETENRPQVADPSDSLYSVVIVKKRSLWPTLFCMKQSETLSLTNIDDQNSSLRFFHLKPVVVDTVDGFAVRWPSEWFVELVEQEEIVRELNRYQRRGQTSIIKQLGNLTYEENSMIRNWCERVAGKSKLVYLKRTVAKIVHNGVTLSDVPSFEIFVRVQNESEVAPQSRGRSWEHTRPEGKRNSETRMPRRPSKEDPAASRPTYIKVHRDHIDPQTLDVYNVPWEWYNSSPDSDYIIIKQWLCRHDQEVLFEHTRRLRSQKTHIGPRELELEMALLKSERERLLLIREKDSLKYDSPDDAVNELLAKFTTVYEGEEPPPLARTKPQPSRDWFLH